MASITDSERKARRDVMRIHYDQDVQPNISTDIQTIRTRLLKMFTEELDLKLNNLQEDEGIMLTFRVDIRGTNGRIRGLRRDRQFAPYINWRNSVFQRDNYTCQECGKRSDVQAHHIKEWAQHPDLRYNVNNGVTLCVDCHANKHPKQRALIYASPRKKNKTKR
jgi:5-methylcytosine-specific restriction endonuclease McrA